MDEYSIETKSEKIYNRKTKEYFVEVVSSYHQKNYRSATVMLWSVAICDLLFKLKHMVDMYGDATAKSIISEVEGIQNRNTKSSEWEYKLIEKIEKDTSFLEVQDVENLKYLQQQRHLAAHPVLSKDLELHSPNKETVRSLIRNTLDGVLTKPPIYTNRIFDEILMDLELNSTILINKNKLKLYLESKYLSNSDKNLELKLIRKFWKIVFFLSNTKCNTNRAINFLALKILIERNNGDLESLINGENQYYSKVSTDEKPIIYLISIISEYPKLYTLFTNDLKIVIEYVVENNIKAKCMGWFLKGNLSAHAKDMKDWLTGDEYPKLKADEVEALKLISDSEEWDEICVKLFNSYYSSSPQYDDADYRFLKVIKPYISSYSEENLLDLINKIGKNCQVYDRRDAPSDHKLIKNQCDIVMKSDFDISNYTGF